MSIINKMASISWSISKHEQLHLFPPMRVHLQVTETSINEKKILMCNVLLFFAHIIQILLVNNFLPFEQNKPEKYKQVIWSEY
jgi:hypothetical protein